MDPVSQDARADPAGARPQRPLDARQGAPEGGREGAQPDQPGHDAPEAGGRAGAAGYRLRRLLRATLGRGLRRARIDHRRAARGDGRRL